MSTRVYSDNKLMTLHKVSLSHCLIIIIFMFIISVVMVDNLWLWVDSAASDESDQDRGQHTGLVEIIFSQL